MGVQLLQVSGGVYDMFCGATDLLFNIIYYKELVLLWILFIEQNYWTYSTTRTQDL